MKYILYDKCNLDQQFIAYASAVDWNDGSYGLAYCYYPFYLIKNGTNYSLPDFSAATMKLESDMPYRVTNIDWAVIQIFDSASNNVIGVYDSRFEDPTTSIVDQYDGILDLPTSFVVGNYPLRLVIVTGTNYQYKVYGAQGNQISELPFGVTKPVISRNQSRVSVTTGDVGRYLTLQGSTNFVNWVNLTQPYETYYTGFDDGFSYSETNSFKARFYRVSATTWKP